MKSIVAKEQCLGLGSEVGNFLLLLAGSCIDFIIGGMSGPYDAAMNFRTYDDIMQKRIHGRVALQYLKQQHFIRVKKHQKVTMLRFSKKGIVAVLREKIFRSEAYLPSGQRCLVVFDFPMHARNQRDTFRYFLKEAKLVRVQQSVWSTERNIGALLLELSCALKFQDWVHVYHARKMNSRITVNV